MKKFYVAFLMLVAAVAFSGSAFAEDKPYAQKTDDELTKDEAVMRISEFNAKIKDLADQLTKIDADNVRLKQELETTIKNLKDCQENVYKLLGATSADVEKFRQALGQVEGKIRAKQRLSQEELSNQKDELANIKKELDALRGNKISVHPDFYNKIIALAKDLNALISSADTYVNTKDKSYTVGTWAKDKDCLWNIAGKIDNYGDPLQWPKIWQANTSVIKNPDIIFPGQVLKVPPAGQKTPEEIKAERKYWRSKRAIEQKRNEETTGKKGQ
jgi:nucleoid-associated protein YgaU